MEIWNERVGVRIAWNVEQAKTFGTRLRGWMGRHRLSPGAALVIEPCNSVHTWFMRISIDVVFLDRNSRVLRMMHAVAPYKVSPIVRGAAMVVELPAGTLAATGTQTQDVLVFQ